jgi:N-acetylglucosamine-6-phosphate deacetylase
VLRSPTSGDVAGLLRAAGTDGALAMVTLAPELPGALEAIAQLVAAGVRVSIGHTDATADQVGNAAAAGATLVTHLYNAQRPLHHREPGVVGQALVDERLTLGLIADLHHVAPGALRLAFAAAGSRIAVVSDAVTAADQTAPPRLADGTLAGAVAVLDESVRNLIGLGLDPALVLRAVTATPARALGRADIGQVRAGCRADLVAWTADWRVARVWVGGRVVA